MKKFSILVATLALAGGSAVAQAESVTMSFLNDDGSVGKSAGTVTLEQTKGGLKFTPKLAGLPPGEHGFHVHEKGSCESTTVDGKVMPGAPRAVTWIRTTPRRTRGRWPRMATWATCRSSRWRPMAAPRPPWWRRG
ncbi:superoxide dismutase [Achromobacter ruhlandii]|nr:superoxide dismutase [Achromobacter ruhlandii]